MWGGVSLFRCPPQFAPHSIVPMQTIKSSGIGSGDAVIHSTWNESRNDEFPEVIKYRNIWEDLGYIIAVTPNDRIHEDVARLDALFPSHQFLSKFEQLATKNMQFDFWRYAKLYLEGGVYADVDVEPLPGISDWIDRARSENKTIFFEEANVPDKAIYRFLVPLVSDYTELPAYATCVVISPGPGASIFVDILDEMDPKRWLHIREPKRTLLSVGPGYVTHFIKQRQEHDMFTVSYKQRKLAYSHHGFGTWKSWLPKEYILALTITPLVILVLVAIKYQRIKRAWTNWGEEPSPRRRKSEDHVL